MCENSDTSLEVMKRYMRIAMNTVLLIKYLLDFDRELQEMEEMMTKSNLAKEKGDSND